MTTRCWYVGCNYTSPLPPSLLSSSFFFFCGSCIEASLRSSSPPPTHHHPHPLPAAGPVWKATAAPYSWKPSSPGSLLLLLLLLHFLTKTWWWGGGVSSSARLAASSRLRYGVGVIFIYFQMSGELRCGVCFFFFRPPESKRCVDISARRRNTMFANKYHMYDEGKHLLLVIQGLIH